MGKTDLSKAIISQNHLTNRQITTSELPYRHKTDSELGENCYPEDKLAKPKNNADPELGHCDQPEGKLTNGDDAFSHAPFAISVSAKGNVKKRIAQIGSSRFIFKSAARPNRIGGEGGAAVRTGAGLVTHLTGTLAAFTQGHLASCEKMEGIVESYAATSVAVIKNGL
jgi:hypothetical protein